MWVFCACPAWCCWIRHPHRSFRPRRMTKTYYGWTTLDPRFVSKYQTLCLLFTMRCGGKRANICTLRHFCRIYTGFEHIHSPWNSFDRWTDGREKKMCVFFKPFWLGQVQTGRIFLYFGRIFPHFRTPSGRPSAKKVRLKKKMPLHVCIVSANLPRKNCRFKIMY